MVNVPIVIVTKHFDIIDDEVSGDYKNFKFRLKKSLKEREAYLEKRIEKINRRRNSDTSIHIEKEILKKRLKDRKKKLSNLRTNKINPH